MRKFMILAISLLALAVPAAGIASVAVDADGYGFVGKGDVQIALGAIDDTKMQSMWTNKAVTFKTSYNLVLDNTINCMKYTPGIWPPFVNTGDTYHVINTTPATQAVTAMAITNKHGKLTGWNLTGLDGPVTYGEVTTVTEGACPSGTFNGSTASQVPTTSPSVLQVTGGGVTADLPNTPVVLPV